MTLNRITLLVDDVDRASGFYQEAFGFDLVEDAQVSATKRVVRVAPKGSLVSFNLAEPKAGDEALIGHQAGQRVLAFLDTDNLEADLARFAEHAVVIIDGPREEAFGRCVLVNDLVGNTWEFVERLTETSP